MNVVNVVCLSHEETSKLSERTTGKFNNIDERYALKQIDQAIPLSVGDEGNSIIGR